MQHEDDGLVTAQRRRMWGVPGTHRRRSALRARDWRVRTKLAAVLTVPLLGFLVVAGMQISESVRTAADLDRFSDQVSLGVEVTALVHELQRERDRTAGMLASIAAPTGAGPPVRDLTDLSSEWAAVDHAVERLQEAAKPLLVDDAVARLYRQAQTQLDELAQVRAGVGQGWLRTRAVFDKYTSTIAALQEMLARPVDVGGDAVLGRIVRGFTNLALAKELTAQIRGQLYLVCFGTSFEAGTFEQIGDVRAERQAAIERFRGDATQPQLARFDDTVAGQAVRNASRLEQAIIVNGASAGGSVDPQQWWSASTTELELMRTVEQSLLESAVSAVNEASSVQWRTTMIGSLTSIGLLLLAVMMSVMIGRNMASTLRSLRAQALHVAEVRLPNIIEQLRLSPTKAPPLRVDPIVVDSHDEIAEVAEAFTAVHRSAVRLAAEQASMRRNVNEIFIKLALRSQTLVERQLQLLDTMESSEIDPDQLHNLFRLDHLAARLRRNDENLLVLAGGDTSRHWNSPKELTTIVLAAAAEVEHYQRVRHEGADMVFVVGHAVADLVNLLAELLENGTAFSPPETVVQVRGHALADGSAELIITDEGLGMSGLVLAQANEQVSAPVSIDISAAERMGLVVVGHLAKRHGITVTLRSPGQGVTVRVGIPAALVAAAPADEPPQADRAWWPRPAGEPGSGATPATAGSATRTAAADPARRNMPTRAENVLTPDRPAPSIWWSRDGQAKAKPAVVAPVAPVEKEVVAVTEAGLPVRVRMAHLPADARAKPVEVVFETNPDEVGDTLSRFYSGMRRAKAEADAEETDPSVMSER